MYCKTLQRLADAHKMQDKLNRLASTALGASTLGWEAQHNKWDKELGEFMQASEKLCTKRKCNRIEFSPGINLLLKRRAILRWILRWHEGKVRDTRNLQRAARRNGLERPLELTRDEVEAQIYICIKELQRQQENAPSLRKEHLYRCANKAKQCGDKTEANEIRQIIRREEEQLCQRRINRAVQTPKGRSVLRVQLNDPKITPDGHETILQREVDIVPECNSS